MLADFIAIMSRQEFLVVALGTVVLAIASGMVGTFSVLKGQSLIGDAISHSALPGIILAFILFQTKDPLILSIGAFISGTVAFIIIQTSKSASKITLDSMLAITLSSLFGFGMVLMSGLRSFESTKNLNTAGLDNYIFGQAAFTMRRDVIIITTVSIISIALMLLFYKELTLFVFDEEYAKTSGFYPKYINTVLLIMTMILIGVGMKIVGAILISSMLIAPGVTGLLWSKKLNIVLMIAAFVGAFSAFFGSLISAVIKNVPTGASIVVIMTAMCMISLIIAPGGLISRSQSRRNELKKLTNKAKAGGAL